MVLVAAVPLCLSHKRDGDDLDQGFRRLYDGKVQGFKALNSQ